jgi:hypothetical protein
MSDPTQLPAVNSPSGLVHVAPDNSLWSIFRYPDSDQLLIQRYDAQDRPLPDWRLSEAAYEDYRARNPQLDLPGLDQGTDDAGSAGAEAPASESECRHIAHAGRWTVTSVEPDWCAVGGQAIPFDSHAELGSPERASPNVKARGTPVYAVSHLGRGVQGNAGEGLGSGGSGDSGYTQILSGQNNVKVNGLPVGRHDSLALINCDASGCGGALGQLHTGLKPVSFVEQLNREFSKTPEELQADMAYHRQAQADANARAETIDRQIRDLRAQADHASTWNPFNSERRAIGRQIEALQASQRSAASSALWHNDQQRRLFERLYPEAAAGPVMSAAPTSQEARELARRGAEIERERARMEAMYSGPFGAAAAMAGVPPELAQAVNMVTTLGRRPTTAARPVRLPRQSRSQPGTAAQPSPGRPSAQQGRVQVSTSRPGVYVQPPPRTPRIKLRCFKKNKTGSKAEYDRQLADQERGLNDMSVKDYLEGRARYREMGRKGTGAAQEAARAEYARELTEKFENDLLKQGIVGSQAQQRAAAMAAERMKTLAALHSPDLIAGGKDVVSSLGDRGVNSSIGAQWKPRVQVLDAAAMKVPETERAGTKMNAELVRCP